ncbi:hypothetical protein HMPREF9440_02463 [Sutterella parvirubra YIT 11816]|uniref:Uncharacterized protein n=1 Tax=Sutterella parvirubra YIT 11816 TaxID=762967 RepID=H3KI60_9BURK|nr:hypothetical protein HMPREF9440_02463 [Sutterella parvirubra YIT 11816]
MKRRRRAPRSKRPQNADGRRSALLRRPSTGRPGVGLSACVLSLACFARGRLILPAGARCSAARC